MESCDDDAGRGRLALRRTGQDLPARRRRVVRRLALGAGRAHATGLLRPAVAEWNGARRCCSTLGARRFYIFGLVLYPQDFIYLTGLLSSRLFAVPVHRGGRAAVVRLCLPADGLHRDLPVDRAPVRRRPHARACASTPARWNFNRLWRKGGKQAVWVAIGAVDRFHLRRLLHADPRAGEFFGVRWSPGPGNGSGSCSTVATYGNAGFMREQVCKYMCPTRASRARCSTRTR